MLNHRIFSLTITTNNKNQLNQSTIAIHFFDTLALDLYIANAEIIINKTSKLDHHVGLASQHDITCAWAANKKGVAIQCIRHKVLDRIPIESDLLMAKIMNSV